VKSAKGGTAVGVGIAACAACCAGPILAAVGGAAAFIGVATFVAGVAGLGVAVVVAVVFALRWRRQRDQYAPEAVAVPAPTRRVGISNSEANSPELSNIAQAEMR
jgi:hypothetical protein